MYKDKNHLSDWLWNYYEDFKMDRIEYKKALLEGFFSKEKLSITAFFEKYITGDIRDIKEDYKADIAHIKKTSKNGFEKEYRSTESKGSMLYKILKVYRAANGKLNKCIDPQKCKKKLSDEAYPIFVDLKKTITKFKELEEVYQLRGRNF